MATTLNSAGEVIDEKTGRFVPGFDNIARWRDTIRQNNETQREELKGKFLAAFEERYNMARAANTAGVTLRAIEYWMKDDPEFKQAVDELREMHLDDIQEQGLVNRAKNQNSRDGATAAVMLMNAHRPETYKRGRDDGSKSGDQIIINFISGTAPTEPKRLPAQSGGEITIADD